MRCYKPPPTMPTLLLPQLHYPHPLLHPCCCCTLSLLHTLRQAACLTPEPPPFLTPLLPHSAPSAAAPLSLLHMLRLYLVAEPPPSLTPLLPHPLLPHPLLLPLPALRRTPCAPCMRHPRHAPAWAHDCHAAAPRAHGPRPGPRRVTPPRAGRQVRRMVPVLVLALFKARTGGSEVSVA